MLNIQRFFIPCHITLKLTGFCLQIYTSFYCRQNEPSYIKMIKLEILSAIADETNAYDITTELTEYVTDIDEPLGRAAVKAVGRIALEVVRHSATSFQPYFFTALSMQGATCYTGFPRSLHCSAVI